MLELVETDNGTSQRDFDTHFPAVDHTHKHYSLEPDISTGWRPKNKIMGPVPINFDAKLHDEIVDQLTSFGSRYKERVIYLGHRFGSSFKMHQQMQREYSFKYEGAMGANYQHMAAYFRKFHANFKSKCTRLFKGMNPTIKPDTELVFEGNFESGNLDTVIKIGQNEYDLFMRIDTNTRGHLQWFNFKVKNCGKKRIKLNIVNLKKDKTMYQRGMRPYVYSEYQKQTKEVDWAQGGENVSYRKRKLVYSFLDQRYDPEFITPYCLSFTYTFEVDWEEVQFAYCPPFTYTDMMAMLVKLKRSVYNRLDKDTEEMFIKQENLCDSLSGLEIPLLTITNPKIDDKKKKCILVSGRIHPGQSCGSFMGKGLLEFICGESEEAVFLRKSIVFKVIPMINPDGVVIGNFRTSLAGRDLNRTFRMTNEFLIPEVKALKELVIRLKNEFKSRFIMFFDLHGHSVKKNVFLYGPEYEIWETNYYRTRIFPKLLANKTPIFRYYSCIFRVAEFKRSTARAVVLKNVPHCYTIEASTGFYYCHTEKKDIPFTPERWTHMGRKIGEALKDYVDILNEQQLIKEQRKQKQISLRTMKNRRLLSKKNTSKESANKFQTRLILANSNKSKYFEDNNQKKGEDEIVSKKERDLIELIKQDEKKHKEAGMQSGHQSDAFSQGGSDSESGGDDIPEQQMAQFQEKIFNYMQQYREKFYREKDDRHTSHKEPPKKKTLKEDDKRIRKNSRGLQLIASLRKKNNSVDKAKQILMCNRIKQQFKQIRSKNVEESFESRMLMSRQEVSPDSFKGKGRRHLVESEVLRKRQTFSGVRQLQYDK